MSKNPFSLSVWRMKRITHGNGYDSKSSALLCDLCAACKTSAKDFFSINYIIGWYCRLVALLVVVSAACESHVSERVLQMYVSKQRCRTTTLLLIGMFCLGLLAISICACIISCKQFRLPAFASLFCFHFNFAVWLICCTNWNQSCTMLDGLNEWMNECCRVTCVLYIYQRAYAIEIIN